MLTKLARLLIPALCAAACAAPQTPGPGGHVGGDPQTPGPAGPAPAACASPAACEQRASARLEAARRDPAALTALLHRFPKGGDIHNHLAGAVYAESYVDWAREDGFRLDGKLTLVDASKCAPGACTEVPAGPTDPRFDTVVRAWSMKDFQPGAESGHDHFFAAFSRFGLASHQEKHEGAMLAETMRRAADDGAIYLEVLVTVVRPLVNDIVKAAGTVDPADLRGYEQKLRADPRWATLVATSRDKVDELDRRAREALHCGPEGRDGAAAATTPACGLTVRYLGQIGRTAPASLIFGEVLASFEVSRVEPRLAGLNLVSPEDNATALQDYDLQMSMIGMLGDEFRGKSPLRVTLHAGELTPAIVPPAHPEYLSAHVRNAVEIAHAERIGHGVDVLGERDAPGLLAEMRAKGVTVEICLTSNDTILGVSGPKHPLSAYLAAGVPVTLATDDAGVSRGSLTGEYTRAVAAQGLTYPQLKAMARRSLTAAFLSDASLRARLERKLEDQLTAFESE